MPWALGIAVTLSAAQWRPVVHEATPEQAVVVALERHGIHTRAQEVSWVLSPSLLGEAEGLVRGWKPGEAAEIFVVHGRVTPGGSVLGEPSIHNLTKTDSADEGSWVRAGPIFGLEVKQGGLATGIRVLDLRGEPPLEGQWAILARIQNNLTNLQQTGRWSGVGNRFWAVEPPGLLQLSFDERGLVVNLGGKTLRLPNEGGEPVGAGAEHLRFHEERKAHPGNLVTWAVDRVRAFPWFGDERMQWVKAVVFVGLDLLKRAQSKLLSDNTATDIAADLGATGLSGMPTTSYTDPETGWPPAPMKPFISKALEGEGQWIALDKDPFVQVNPGAPPAFVTSYIRADRERSYTRIYVTMWDPRQVELHMMAGAIEPKGPSGEAGPGLVPRAPERMKRLVAACNGGFQALHGEFGMMADTVVYLPPKPYGATVVALKDGSTGFGTWPNSEEIPADVLSFRQNLTPLIQDGKLNPYGRTWWGGTPPDWEDRVHSTRTGICLTQENFVAYFYGNEIDSMPLAQAMIQARCKYGIHLDMNPGHTGLEFYRAMPASAMPTLGRPMQKDWEAEGPVEGMDGWSFRARRMIRHMGLMNFPRYIQREARDFFYLTLRPVLPGDNVTPVIQPPEPDEGQWRTKGLPQHGFPYAVATTTLRPDASRPNTRVFLLKIDPRTVRPVEPAALNDSSSIVLTLSNMHVEGHKPTVWLSGGAASISAGLEPANAVALASGMAVDAPEAAEAQAALGVQDEDGMLIYAEVQGERRSGADQAMVVRLLTSMGCSSVVLLNKSLLPTFGNEAPPRDGRGNLYDRVVRLERAEAPAAKSVFSDTPVVGPKEWAPLQAKRVRYFKRPHATPASSSATPKSPVTAASQESQDNE